MAHLNVDAQHFQALLKFKLAKIQSQNELNKNSKFISKMIEPYNTFHGSGDRTITKSMRFHSRPKQSKQLRIKTEQNRRNHQRPDINCLQNYCSSLIRTQSDCISKHNQPSAKVLQDITEERNCFRNIKMKRGKHFLLHNFNSSKIRQHTEEETDKTNAPIKTLPKKAPKKQLLRLSNESFLLSPWEFDAINDNKENFF